MDWTQTTTTDDEGNETTDWVRGPVGVWVVPDPEAAGVRHYSETEAGSDKSEEQIEAEYEAAQQYSSQPEYSQGIPASSAAATAGRAATG